MQAGTAAKPSIRPRSSMSNLQLWDAPPSDARPILVGSVRRGYEWSSELGRICLLTDIIPSLGQRDRATQTTMVLDQMEALLDRVGFSFKHVVRTWFYLDDILSWYGDFNRARTRFYSERGLLGRAPASTAVGMPNDSRALLCAHLLAIDPGDARTSIALAASPLQGAAFDYGSAFSRALLVSWPNGKRLYISGTASIDAGGKTLYPFSTERQIHETSRVVGALLERHGFHWNNVTLATAYLPDLRDEGLLRVALQRYLTRDPCIARADICRADLRFELELVAERKSC